MRTTVTLAVVVLLVVISSAVAKPKNRFTRYPSWNTRMYPVWKDGDPRYRDAWKGGKVKFIVGNDAPTLTKAKVTFTIDLEFPHNQKVLPSGEVVWDQDCTINGTSYKGSEPVYPAQHSDSNSVFPDGTPFKKGDKKPSYVFVWKTWDQYWQVVSDGPSSSLTIGTDNIPLGSYIVDIVIYHYRSKDKFIPLGYASTQFSITDQIPFAVSLTQVNDIDEADMRFVQNRAIAFSISLHDPSEYLSDADITFNWDFGDNSGAFISRELIVTHTYITAGDFKPRVVVQAVIPDGGCATPANAPTPNSVTYQPPGPPVNLSTVRGPAASETPLIVSTQGTAINLGLSAQAAVYTPEQPMDTEEDLIEEEASSGSATQTAQNTPSPMNSGTPKATVTSVMPEAMTENVETDPEAPATETATQGPQAPVVVVVAKREAGDEASDHDCVIYRYGSFCTGIEIVEGIEKVEIVHVDNAVMRTSEVDQNVVDLTVTCQGSLPTEVCSVVLDAECMMPIHTVCNAIAPSSECQLVQRHFFYDSGVFCINVSMTNDVSLAVTSTRLSVTVAGSSLSSGGTVAMVMGVLIAALAVGTVAYTYRRFKKYRPLKEDSVAAGPQQDSQGWFSAPGRFWNLLSRRATVDNCPLLQDRLV